MGRRGKLNRPLGFIVINDRLQFQHNTFPGLEYHARAEFKDIPGGIHFPRDR